MMSGGIAMDRALNAYHQAKIDGTTEFRSTHNLTEYFVSVLDELSDEKQLPKDSAFQKTLADGCRLIPTYPAQYGEKVDPVSVQQEVEHLIAGHPQKGYLDLVHTDAVGKTIADHKFTTRKPAETSAKDSLQLISYDIAVDDPSHRVQLVHGVRRVRTADWYVHDYVVTSEDRGRLERIQVAMHSLIEQGIYIPTDPTNWWCKPEKCDYWKHCRGRQGGPLPLPGEPGYVEEAN
jgi:hypothetical protein